MKTHTTRWSGDRQHRIITFTPTFMKLLKTAKHDRAIRIVISELLSRNKQLTGIKHTIAYDQLNELDLFAKTIETHPGNTYQYWVEIWIIDGIKTASMVDIVDLFNKLNVILPTIHESFKNISND